MNSVSTIVVRYSSHKRTILILLSAFLLISGVAILAKSFSAKPFLFSFVMPLGIIFLLGFIAIIFYGRRLLINDVVLVIDDNGVMDNSEAEFSSFFPWKDVKEIKKRKVGGKKLICVIVNNPNDYLKKGTSLIQQKKLDFNNTYCSTPVVISCKDLSMDHYTLIEVLQRKHNLYKEQKNSFKVEKNISVHS